MPGAKPEAADVVDFKAARKTCKAEGCKAEAVRFGKCAACNKAARATAPKAPAAKAPSDADQGRSEAKAAGGGGREGSGSESLSGAVMAVVVAGCLVVGGGLAYALNKFLRRPGGAGVGDNPDNVLPFPTGTEG